MGFKDLFIKPSPKEEEEVKQSSSNTQPPPVPYIPPVYTSPVAQNNTSPTSEDFSVFLDQLKEALDTANMPNVQDYMDLRQALQNMQGMGMDESIKFQAVFATLQAAGCDLKALLDSFDYYRNIIDSEKSKFEEALESATDDSVRNKSATVQSLVSENTRKAEDIKQLTEEINANQQKITSLQVEISSANSKIEQKRANFMAAYQNLVNEMENDKKKVERYISAMPAQTKTKKSKK